MELSKKILASLLSLTMTCSMMQLPVSASNTKALSNPSIKVGKDGYYKYIYANGNDLIIEGTDDKNTTIYVDENRNGKRDSGEKSLKDLNVADAPDDGSDLFGSAYFILAGKEDNDYIGDITITLNSGKVLAIGATLQDEQTSGDADTGSITGNVMFNVTGGYVDTLTSVFGTDEKFRIDGNFTLEMSGGQARSVFGGGDVKFVTGKCEANISGNSVITTLGAENMNPGGFKQVNFGELLDGASIKIATSGVAGTATDDIGTVVAHMNKGVTDYSKITVGKDADGSEYRTLTLDGSELKLAAIKTNHERLEEAKPLAQSALNGITATNDTTSANILDIVNSGISSVSGITATWKAAPTITKATSSADGSIVGTIVLTCESEKIEITVNKTINKLPIPTPDKPTITVGNYGSTHQVNSGKDMIFTCSGKLEDLIDVYVDGKLVDASNYTLKSGSTILTLKASYLDTLSVGSHTLKFQYKDNLSADTTFTVTAKTIEPAKPDTTSPKTGDTSNTMLYFSLIVLSGCAGIFVFRRKKAFNK